MNATLKKDEAKKRNFASMTVKTALNNAKAHTLYNANNWERYNDLGNKKAHFFKIL